MFIMFLEEYCGVEVNELVVFSQITTNLLFVQNVLQMWFEVVLVTNKVNSRQKIFSNFET